jgi:hypothetical protein
MDIVLNLLKLLIKYQPDWLYEAMPYLYLVTGVVVILYFDSTAGYVSGTLFLVAVASILVMRRHNRTFR